MRIPRRALGDLTECGELSQDCSMGQDVTSAAYSGGLNLAPPAPPEPSPISTITPATWLLIAAIAGAGGYLYLKKKRSK